MASGAGTVTLKFAGDLTELQKALSDLPGDVQKSLGVTAKVTQSASTGAVQAHGGHATAIHKVGAAATATGAALTGIGGVVAEAFSKGQQATDGLGAALQATGQKTGDWQGELEKAQASNRKLGISNDQTTQSLQTLVQAGVKYNDAVAAQGKIADIAAAQHISLADATTEVARATTGKAGALKTLGVVTVTQAQIDALHAKDQKQEATDTANVTKAQQAYSAAVAAHGSSSSQAKAAETALNAAQAKRASDEAAASEAEQAQGKKASDLQGILAQTQARVAGAAQAQANTTAGKVAQVKVAFESVAESIGNKLGPAISVALPVATGLSTVMGNLGPILGLFKSGTEAATVATEAQTVATEGGTVASDAMAASEGLALGPILLIVAGIALLVAAVILIVTHFQTFKDILGDIGNFIKNVFVGAFDFIKDLFTKTIPGWIGDVIGFFTSIPGKLGGLAQSIGSSIVGMFKGGVNDVIGLLNSVLKTIGDIGGSFGPFSFHVRDAFGGHMPQIPTFGTGGLVPGALGAPTLALVHGGEQILTPGQQAANGNRQPQAASGGHTFITSVSTNATADQIVRAQSWAFRKGGY